jgi:hypothetical protein
MASADITTKDTLVKGVNSMNNYIRSEAHILDGVENPGILDADTHSLFVIPKGNALVGLKIVALADTTSSGSATLQFKAKIGSTAEAIHTAIAKADLAAGDVVVADVAKIKGYDAENDTVIQLTVGTAALTAVKLLVIAEFLPIVEFMTAG